MGFLSNLIASSRKSSRLQELQQQLHPPKQRIEDIIARVRSGDKGREELLEQYLDLCEADPGVRQVMGVEQLSRQDLKQIYVDLLTAGLGQWIKGHFAALSTIAYVEPLQFAARAPKIGIDNETMLGSLLLYWEGRIPQGALLTVLRTS